MSRTFIVLLAIVLAPVAYVVGSFVLEPEPPLEIEISEKMSEQETEMAIEWLQDFRDSCPKLFTTFKEHISDARVEVWESIPYVYKKYGWDKEIFFSVQISEDSNVARGHIVTYHISRDGTPGWYTQKEEGAEVCGRTADPDGDKFVGF